MPWSETTAMEERKRFVLEALRGRFSMTELCQAYQVSRPTGYKWVERFGQEGEKGLADRSRAPHSCPWKTEPAVVEGLIRLRRKHPYWGPKKLIRVLSERFPEEEWPAVSTAGGILKREGLISSSRRRRRPLSHPGYRPVTVEQANDLWTSDFKGQFRMGNRRYCFPLTVADSYSRYLLGCQGLDTTHGKPAQEVFERLFRRYGLPAAILTDNGTPFSSNSPVRLSRLSIWWIRLGIQPITIEPASPQQNGRHERMHWTLKQQTAFPPAANREAQQRAFDRFRKEYNQLRPHEALGQTPPARHYRPSSRPYPTRLAELEYPGHFEIRRVGSSGCISWKGHSIHLTETLAKENVGLEEIEDGIWSLFFGPVLLGHLDERSQRPAVEIAPRFPQHYNDQIRSRENEKTRRNV